MPVGLLGLWFRIHLCSGEVRATPNDLKLSDTPGWRGSCAAGGEGGGPEAGAVTAGRVRLQRMVRRCGHSEKPL